MQIDTHEISGNGVYVEGTVAVELLYITTDDEMPIGSLKGFLPFHQTIEVPGIEKNSRYEIKSGLEQLTTILDRQYTGGDQGSHQPESDRIFHRKQKTGTGSKLSGSGL